MRLTEEQRQFVADNHNLIYSCAKCMDLDLEEYYDLLAIGLCKAGCLYDRTRGAFSTFAFLKMRQECMIYWRSLQSSTHIPEVLISSYDEMLDFGDGEDHCVDLLSSLIGPELDLSEVYVKEFLSSLGMRRRMILTDYANGYSGRDIAKALGVTPQAVYQTLKGIQRLWLRYDETNKINLFKNERKQHHADR